MSDSVQYELSGDVAILRIDDGKANALDPTIIGSLRDDLRRAEKEAAAVAGELGLPLPPGGLGGLIG